VGITHWDDVDPVRREHGAIAASWRFLGQAAGSADIGVRRIEIDPACRSTAVHVHLAEEEFFWVLAGDGLSWQDGRTWPVEPGDVLLHRRGAEPHTLVAGPQGLDVLAFGTRARPALTPLPRTNVAWAVPTWVQIGGGDHPFTRDDAAGPLEAGEPETARPATLRHRGDVPAEREEHGEHAFAARDLGRALGSEVSGLSEFALDPGRRGVPLHRHSAEEELFVVLDGGGTLELGGERLPVRAGHVVSCRPGTGVDHAFVAGPDGPLTYLAYGTREPNDICYFPRSNKVRLAGIGLMARIEGGLGYWDGEP
jgi:uncharacterized cupin superfamily protein